MDIFGSLLIAVPVVSLVVIGVMELLKKYIPTEKLSSKILGLISLGISVVLAILFSLVMKLSWVGIITCIIGVVGVTQVAYDFILKLLKNLTAVLQSKVKEKAEELTKKKK